MTLPRPRSLRALHPPSHPPSHPTSHAPSHRAPRHTPRLAPSDLPRPPHGPPADPRQARRLPLVTFAAPARRSGASRSGQHAQAGLRVRLPSRQNHGMASLPGCATSLRDRGVLALRGQKSHGRSHRRRRARATGRDQEGSLCRTWAEELELSSVEETVEPKGLAWSMAAAGRSESLAAPAVAAGSSEASRTKADIPVTKHDVHD